MTCQLYEKFAEFLAESLGTESPVQVGRPVRTRRSSQCLQLESQQVLYQKGVAAPTGPGTAHRDPPRHRRCWMSPQRAASPQ